MFYFTALAFFSSMVFIATKHLNQSIESYADLVALLMVAGGTSAVALVVLPWENWRDVLRGLRRLFAVRGPDKRVILKTCLDVVANPHMTFDPKTSKLQGLPADILRDGLELISLGFTAEKIETILRERVFQYGRRAKRTANAFKGLAKYPPAFGLVGTVLGLVNLMQGISSGMDSKETGIKMAVALVATLYGLMTANLIVNPAGEMIYKSAQTEEELGELVLQAILLAADRTSMLEAQELLNSYVGREHRISSLASIDGETSGEAAA